MNESRQRARYTLEFKLEAVRLVKGGQVAAVTAKILLIRPCEVSSRVANPASLEVADHALRVLLQHRHVLVGSLA